MLDALGRRLNREAGSPPIPWLFFFTDPRRTPDPCRIAARLPRGAAVVFRHFGMADRRALAQRLAILCRRRGLLLLIAADPALALAVGAGGVHWPERWRGRRVAKRREGWIETASAHGRAGLARAGRMGMDACVLAPVFPSRSASAIHPLGPLKAGRLARAARVPVIALGGVQTGTAKRLPGRGFAGIAAVSGLVD